MLEDEDGSVEVSEEDLETEFEKEGAEENTAEEAQKEEETPAEEASETSTVEVTDESKSTEDAGSVQEVQKPVQEEPKEEVEDVDTILDGLGDTKIGSGEQETTLAALKEEYPAVYDAAKKIAEVIAGNMIKPWQAKIDAITKREEASLAERQIEENRQALERAMPGSLEILGSDKFITWFNKQSKRVRDLAGEGSDLEDHKSLMSLYNSANPSPTKTRISIPSISKIGGKANANRPRKMTLTDEEMEEEFFRE